MMLIGVGGSGKKSLARLSALVSGCKLLPLPRESARNMSVFFEFLKEVNSNTSVTPLLHFCKTSVTPL
jgi:hypothetical protein